VVQVQIDASDLTDLVGKRIPRHISAALREAASIIRYEGKQVVAKVFLDEMESQDPSAWPGAYTEGVISAIFSELDIQVIPQGTSIDVQADLEDLGTLDQLEAAYHYHAKLAGGATTGIVQLPYQGQELAQPDPNIRYAYWAVSVQDTGREDKTIDARLEQWANKAPQWLMLRDGTTFDPIIRPTPVDIIVTEALSAFGEGVVAALVNQAIGIADRQPNPEIAQGITFEVSGKGSRYRGSGGRFTQSPYRVEGFD
jgi:hypothetical protein